MKIFRFLDSSIRRLRIGSTARLTLGGAAALLVGGCVVSEALEAQRAVKAKAEGALAITNAPPLRLSGYSLEELVEFAMTNRPSVVAARLEVESARLTLKSLAADAPLVSSTPWTAPKLAVSGSYAEASTSSTWSDMNWRTEKGSPTASLSLDLLLWDFGRYDAKANQQAEQVMAAELNLLDTGYAVFDEVASAYFSYWEQNSLREVAETNLLNYANHLARTEARLNAGEANKLDLLRSRLDLAQARQSLVAASNQVETAGATLMNALGIDASRGTAATVLGNSADGIDAVRRAFAATDYGVDAAFQLSRTNAPTMRVKRARLRAASHAVDYAMRDLLPSISGSAALTWTDPLWLWRWGVSVSQNLFQGFRKTTAVEQAVVAMQETEAEVDIAEQQLSVDLETAIANRDNSVSAVASAVASLKSARENLDMINAQLELGDVSRIELSDAIYSYSQAAGDAISAFYDGQRSEAKLFRLVGSYPIYHEEIVRGNK